MNTLFALLRDQLLEVWKQVRAEGAESGVLPLLRPVAPYTGPPLLSPLTMLGVVFWGLHMGFTQGLLATLVADTAPVELRGTAFGVFNFAVGIAMLVASVVAGAGLIAIDEEMALVRPVPEKRMVIFVAILCERSATRWCVR